MSDAGATYAAAVESAVVFDRSARTRLVIRGKAPEQMLKGILTGKMPEAPTALAPDLAGGRATYHTVLTPKGKMITDAWCFRLGDEEADGFLLDVPEAGREALTAHLGRFLPPRMAKTEDVTTRTAMVTVVGPKAAELLSRLALGLRVEGHELSALEEGAWRAVGARPADGLMVVRSGEVWPEAFDVVGPAGVVRALTGALEAGGAPTPGAAGGDAWTTLRVEAGRPAYGADMDDTTIPVEAGIHERAIDYTKGCYTGQEVIVRIRDRGHVNRALRVVRLGNVAPPAKGTELFEADAPEDARPAAVVTSAVRSPREGETLALAYVKRGVEGPLIPR